MILHKHTLVRAEVAEPIRDVEVAKDFLRRLVEKVGMKITPSGGPHVDYVNKPGNLGIAAIVMIETSHCSMHIWDEVSPALVQFDLYSCADYELQTVLDHLQEMKPVKISYKQVDRETGLDLIADSAVAK